MSDNPTIYCQNVYINCAVVSENAETHDLEDLQEPGDEDKEEEEEEEEVDNTRVYLGTSGNVAIEFRQRGKWENITVTLPRSAAQQLMYGLSSILM